MGVVAMWKIMRNAQWVEVSDDGWAADIETEKVIVEWLEQAVNLGRPLPEIVPNCDLGWEPEGLLDGFAAFLIARNVLAGGKAEGVEPVWPASVQDEFDRIMRDVPEDAVF